MMRYCSGSCGYLLHATSSPHQQTLLEGTRWVLPTHVRTAVWGSHAVAPNRSMVQNLCIHAAYIFVSSPHHLLSWRYAGDSVCPDTSLRPIKALSHLTLCGAVVQPSQTMCASSTSAICFQVSPPPPHFTPSSMRTVFGTQGYRYMNEDPYIYPATGAHDVFQGQMGARPENEFYMRPCVSRL
jgi:hypothetical protein